MHESEAHQYTPRAGYLALVGAAGLVAVLVIRLVLDIGSVALLVVAVVVPWVTRGALKLTTEPSGVSVSGREAAWSELALRRAIVSEVIETPKGSRSLSKRVVVQPNVYEARWREGRLGDDVRRWAPKLLEEPEAGSA